MQLVKYNPFREVQGMERDLGELWPDGWGLMSTPANRNIKTIAVK